MSSAIPAPFSRLADGTNRGLMSPSDFTKLAGLPSGPLSTADVSDSIDRRYVTDAQLAMISIADASTVGVVSLTTQTLGAGTKSADRLRTLLGSSSDVALGPNGDDNTGFQFPAPDTINAYVGGALGFQITSTRTMYIGANTNITNLGQITGVEVTASGASNGFILGGTRLVYNGASDTFHLATSGLSATLAGSLGASSGDKVTKFGSTAASVHASSKLLSGGFGIGGTYTEKFYVTGAGSVAIGGNSNCLLYDGGNTVLCSVVLGSSSYMSSTSGSTAFYAAASGGFSASNTMRIWSESQGDAAGEVSVQIGTLRPTADPAAVLTSFGANLNGSPVEYAKVWGSGNFEVIANGGGIYLKSPDGNRWLVSVANGGTLSIASA